MKKIAFILIITWALFPLFPATWSATVEADANVYGETDSLVFDNIDTFTLQGFFPFGSNIPMSMSAEAYYEFEYSKPLVGKSDETITHLVDISTLHFNAQIPVGESDSLEMQFGRFYVNDITNLILAQQMDGASITFLSSVYELSTYIGFTGFTNGHTQTFFGVENKNILSDLYTLAPAFMFANVTFTLPYFIDTQHSFTVDLNGALDVTSNEEGSNRFYATTALQGPIGDAFYYNASATINYLGGTQSSIGNITILELSSFLPFAESILTWKTVFATGGSESSFVPITEIMASSDSALPYSGMLTTGLLAVIRPVNSLFLLIGSDVFFTVMDAAQEKGYTGFQWDFTTRWDIASDVKVIGSIENFFPSDPAKKAYLDASVGLSIIF